jgi:ABC-type multidrug transport system ATPase subunit
MIKINQLTLKKKIPEISRLNLEINKGETYVLLSSGDTAVHHLLNIFSGLETNFQGRVEIDSIDIRSNWYQCSKNIVHLNNGREWPPDMKTGEILSFFKKHLHISEDEFEELYITLNMDNMAREKISEMEEVEWRNILFALTRLKKSKNYIVHDFARGMPLDFNLEFKKSLARLKKEGCSILYLSDDVFFAPEIGDRIGFMKKGKLLLELKASKMKKMSLRELYFQFLAER